MTCPGSPRSVLLHTHVPGEGRTPTSRERTHTLHVSAWEEAACHMPSGKRTLNSRHHCGLPGGQNPEHGCRRAGKEMGQRDSPSLLVEYRPQPPEDSWVVSYRTQHALTTRSSRCENSCPHRKLHTDVCSSCIRDCPDWGQPRSPSVSELMSNLRALQTRKTIRC